MLISWNLPEYRCPQCGSHSIECEGYCAVALYQDEKGHRFAHLFDFDDVNENARCKCTACGNIGRLYVWKVKEDKDAIQLQTV